MTDEIDPVEAEDAPVLSEEERIAKELEENEGWYTDGEERVIPLNNPFISGHGEIKQMRLHDPGGFMFEKLGDPYTILSSANKINLDGDDDKEVKFEVNRKKLNRYVEGSNTPQLGFAEARKISTKDLKAVHNAMLDFF